MSLPQDSGNTPARPNHPTNNPDLEAAALSAGEHPERTEELVAKLVVGKRPDRDRIARMHLLLQRLDRKSIPIETVDWWLEAWTGEPPNDAFDEISRYSTDLEQSEGVNIAFDVFIDMLADAGFPMPDGKAAYDAVRSDFVSNAAQFIRVGMLAALETLAPGITAEPPSPEPQPDDGEEGAEHRLDRLWRVSPDRDSLQALALSKVMQFTSESQYGCDVITAHIDGLTRSPAYGVLLKRLQNPEPPSESGWNAASFAAHHFMAGLCAAAIAKGQRRHKRITEKSQTRRLRDSCAGERAGEYMGDVLAEGVRGDLGRSLRTAAPR